MYVAVFFFVKIKLSNSVYRGRMQAADVYSAEVINSASFAGPIEECHLLQF